MNLAETINKADELVKAAAVSHSVSDSESCLEYLLELRDFINQPIEVDTPGDEDTSENCSLCGQPKED